MNFSTAFSGPTFLALRYRPRDTEVGVRGSCRGRWVAWGEPGVSWSGQMPSVCGTERGKGISYLQKSVKLYTTCSQGYLLMLFKQVK